MNSSQSKLIEDALLIIYAKMVRDQFYTDPTSPTYLHIFKSNK